MPIPEYLEMDFGQEEERQDLYPDEEGGGNIPVKRLGWILVNFGHQTDALYICGEA